MVKYITETILCDGETYIMWLQELLNCLIKYIFKGFKVFDGLKVLWERNPNDASFYLLSDSIILNDS